YDHWFGAGLDPHDWHTHRVVVGDKPNGPSQTAAGCIPGRRRFPRVFAGSLSGDGAASIRRRFPVPEVSTRLPARDGRQLEARTTPPLSVISRRIEERFPQAACPGSRTGGTLRGGFVGA